MGEFILVKEERCSSCNNYFYEEKRDLKRAIQINNIKKICETEEGNAVIYMTGDTPYIYCKESFVEIMQELGIYSTID